MLTALCCVLMLSAGPDVTVTGRSIQPGEVLAVTVTAMTSDAPVTVRAFDRDWPVHALDGGGWRALVGIDLETRIGRHDLIVTASSGRTTRTLDVVRRAFSTRRLTVDPALVNPPADALERIAREARELEEVWKASPSERLWRGRFAVPVPDPPNSAFGTRSILNGEPRSPHNGADFLSPSGRPIKAPNAGRIVIAGSRYFSGNTVVIDHGMGLFSLLAHMSEIGVKAGDMVAAGDVVGKVGATGRVTGAHLHWTVRLNGARVDPLSLLFALGDRRGRD